MAAGAPAWAPRAVMRATLSVLAVALGFAFAYRFSLILLALFVAIVLATGTMPLIDWLARRGLPRVLGASLVFLFLSLPVAGLLLLGLPIASERGQAFAARIPTYVAALREQLLATSSLTLQRIVGQMPTHFAIEMPRDGIGKMAGTLSSVGQALALGAAVLLFGFYWAVLGPRAVRCLLLLAPRVRRAELAEFAAAGQRQLGAFVRGQLVVCATVGALAFASYKATRLPDAFALAVVAGVLEMVPMVGPLVGALPAVLVAFTISPSRALWVIGAAVAIHLLENLVVVPRVMKRAVGVHPALSLLAIAAMGSLLGIPGALLAIPTAALAQLAVDRFLFRRRSAREARTRFTSLRARLRTIVAETDR
jgi:predicted PurR-regulated permease PerM